MTTPGLTHTGGLQETTQDHLPLDVAKHLGVAQEAAKIYVEHVASRLQHDVVIVSVTDA